MIEMYMKTHVFVRDVSSVKCSVEKSKLQVYNKQKNVLT